MFLVQSVRDALPCAFAGERAVRAAALEVGGDGVPRVPFRGGENGVAGVVSEARVLLGDGDDGPGSGLVLAVDGGRVPRGRVVGWYGTRYRTGTAG